MKQLIATVIVLSLFSFSSQELFLFPQTITLSPFVLPEIVEYCYYYNLEIYTYWWEWQGG